MAEEYPSDERYQKLKRKQKKLIERAAIVGAVAGLVILALNDKTQAQTKKIFELTTEIEQLGKNLELAWQNVTDNYLAACMIADVVKPTTEQFKEIEAGLKQIKSQGR